MLVDNSLILQAHRFSPDSQSITWRFLHTTPTSVYIRYIHAPTTGIPPRAYDHAPLLTTLLPHPLPAGPWDSIKLDAPAAGARFPRMRFAGAAVENSVPETRVWADVLEASELRMSPFRDYGPLRVPATTRQGRALRYRFAAFPEDVAQLDCETAILEKVQGLGLTPEWVGHVREGGKVMGYVVEDVGDEAVDAAQDMDKCRAVVEGLHKAGVKLGGVALTKFTKRADGKVVATDLSEASLTDDVAELQAETDALN